LRLLLQALNAEYSLLTEKMSQLGAAFSEELASLKADDTPETHSKIDCLHVKSRVNGTLTLPLLHITSSRAFKAVAPPAVPT
jgi:hypothetical protein